MAMKIIIASDLHGSNYYTAQLIEKIHQLKADKLILLGDILYHGPRNDLPKDYSPKKVFSALNALDIPVVCVRGNCDAEVDQMVLNFDVLTPEVTLCECGFTMHLTHGHNFNIDNPPKNAKSGDVVLSGHTHVPLDEVKEGVRFLNPGSLSIPKENSKHSFILLTEKGFEFLSVNE